MTMTRQRAFNTYRQTYPTFVYERFNYDVRPDGLHIAFSFRVEDRSGKHPVLFAPTAFIPTRPFLSFNHQKAAMDALVFHIGMAELVSYWKCFCPPDVEIRCGSLDATQVAFWKKLYFLGLGEFFYTNGISASEENFMTITVCREQANDDLHLQNNSIYQPSTINSYLVPIGGGKDSVVSLELLRTADAAIRPLILNPRGATVNCAAVAGFGVDDILVIQRTLDPMMLQLNSQGCLNGHTPFSALLAFYSLLAAQLSGVGSIALSNENSANESTVIGTTVNHQYSKSMEFERNFRQYVTSYLGGYNYFSLLRPLCELQIAMLFARNERYFDIFRSCNVGSKQDIWCGHCAKCLFAYIILSPFISPERLVTIFGRNLLDDDAMRPLLLQLQGRAATKPFECVGTVDEVNAALSLTRQRWYATAEQPVLLAASDPLPSPSEVLPMLSNFASDHFLNESLMRQLDNTVKSAAQSFSS